MLYYGDRSRRVAPGALVHRLRASLAGASPDARAALLDAAALAQGLADARFEALGEDGPDPASDLALALTVELARRLWARWNGEPSPDWAPPEIDRLAALPLPHAIAVKEPEGHAHYALYPEAYALAARDLPRDARWVVVGIRTIGTGLAAMAAAALGAAVVRTVRPAGHPFSRALRLSTALRRELEVAAREGARFAVADEGPGLSGSSLLAVVRALEEAGAASGRVTLLPAHLGEPGPAAGEADRQRFRGLGRRVVGFEEAILPRLRAALVARVGATELADLSGGAWREAALAPGTRWPAVFRQQERRKYLLSGGRGRWVARFAALGRPGDEKLAAARALAEAGLAPPALGLVDGFLVQPWLDARPLEAGVPEETLVAHLTRYLGFRARAFPAAREDGAAPERLLEVVRVNAGEALGPDAAAAAAALAGGAIDAARLPTVLVDGKLERWEWLVDGDGRLVKSDAVDHARGHDLAGAQPIAWDVAGAEVELSLSPAAAEELRARVTPEATPRAASFLRAAYLAHRVGRWTFALATEQDELERARIEVELARYKRSLREALT